MPCTLHLAWDERLAGYDFGPATRSRRSALSAIVPPLLRVFAPRVLVSQHGCDTHRLDPLAHLELPVDGQRAAHAAIHALAHETAGG
jgi:acetoin utilization deacetylase AcuC-like enzyme